LIFIRQLDVGLRMFFKKRGNEQMKEDLYVRLGNRLNRNAFQLPLIDEVLVFLKDVFSEAQAELGAQFPLGAHTLKSLARVFSREEKELERLLEDMADEGLIFISKTDEGNKEYSLPPFVPGILEFQNIKGDETDKVKKRLRLIKKISLALARMVEEAYRNDGSAKGEPPAYTLRTIPVEEHLPDKTTTATWEQLTEIINREESFAAGACYCRQNAKMDGHPCQLSDVPQDSCIYFGKVADFMVDRRFARRYSREGILELLTSCEKAGLIHNISNFIGDYIVLCNCCGCCCESLVLTKKYRGLNSIFVGSNFVATVDGETCIGCSQCVEHCQIGALEMKDDIAVVNKQYCLGCGNCVAQCPAGSLSLLRYAENKPPEKNPLIVGLGQ
jgi:Pyruvate/2-oxoacid:ferredoxin oxidoreductase delta subunit